MAKIINIKDKLREFEGGTVDISLIDIISDIKFDIFRLSSELTKEEMNDLIPISTKIYLPRKLDKFIELAILGARKILGLKIIQSEFYALLFTDYISNGIEFSKFDSPSTNKIDFLIDELESKNPEKFKKVEFAAENMANNVFLSIINQEKKD